MPLQEEQYSQEASEILGKVPPWIVRWGIVVLSIILLGVLIGSYFIKFPDKIIAPIVLTTYNPPVELMSRSTGRIDSIFVQDKAVVAKGQIIGLIYNTAYFNDVMHISRLLSSNEDPKSLSLSDSIYLRFNLGELQNYFTQLTSCCADFRHYMKINSYAKRRSILERQINKQNDYYNSLISQKNLIDNDLLFEYENMKRDSLLFAKNVISQDEYEQSQRALLQKRTSNESFGSSIISTEMDILRLKEQLMELELQQQTEERTFEQRIKVALEEFKTQLESWQYQYLLNSPIDGTISFTKYWATNQAIISGDRFASVVPTDSTIVIGRCIVPTAGFGKVAINQAVNIKVSGYPHMEFGIVKGYVVNVSQVPEKDGYVVEVALTDGLNTTYKKRIAMIQQMDGTAEIITKDQRLIMRYLDPIRALFDN